MIAKACLASHLPPEVFGVTDPDDVVLVGIEILEELHDQHRRQRDADLSRRLAAR